jgi:TatD DNase family protein
MLWDAHNHLQHPHLTLHLPALLQELPRLGVAGGVVNGTHPRDWESVRSLCQAHPQWIPAYGVHPWEVDDLPADWFSRLQQILNSDPAATVGEIGLDLWRTTSNFSTQLEVFTQQWNWAAAQARPVTVHCLRAWQPLRQFIQTAPSLPAGFLLHAYGGPASDIDFYAQHGAYFSFSPSFLHRPRKMETFRHIPRERLLLETDAPSMPPPKELAPYSLPPAPDGTTLHDPRNLPTTAQHLAHFLNIPPETLFQQTTTNFQTLFNAPLKP